MSAGTIAPKNTLIYNAKITSVEFCSADKDGNLVPQDDPRAAFRTARLELGTPKVTGHLWWRKAETVITPVLLDEMTAISFKIKFDIATGLDHPGYPEPELAEYWTGKTITVVRAPNGRAVGFTPVQDPQ